MNKYSGTKTEQNLRTAFSGESEARNKYTFFASVLRKRGMSRLPLCSRKQQIMRGSTQSCGLRN